MLLYSYKIYMLYYILNNIFTIENKNILKKFHFPASDLLSLFAQRVYNESRAIVAFTSAIKVRIIKLGKYYFFLKPRNKGYYTIA